MSDKTNLSIQKFLHRLLIAKYEKPSSEDETHETLSDQILGLILLLVISNWLSNLIQKYGCFKIRNGDGLSLVND